MKVIIAGSRNYEGSDVSMIAAAVARSGFDVTEVVSGTAAGIDQMGERWATRNDIPVKSFPPDWQALGKAAGMIRNRQMGDYADALIAIWDGESRGTKGMIAYMRSLGKWVYVCRPQPR